MEHSEGKKGEQKTIEISGTVVTGLGRGRYFMQQGDYLAQMHKKLHFMPYAGTLNVRVPESELEKVDKIKQMRGIAIDGFRKDGREFGSATALNAEINGIKCALIVPKLSKYRDTIELIAEENLRELLELEDGAKVRVHVFI